MTALERAGELMMIPKKDLPLLAREFLSKMANEIGMCGETAITAFAIYAQCVEGLYCDKKEYLASEDDIKWFKSKIKTI